MGTDYKLKFQEAFCPVTEELLSMEDLQKEFAQDGKAAFRKKYSRHLVCPECRQALLSFVNKQTQYLRTSKQSAHIDTCALQQVPIDQDAYFNYIDAIYAAENYGRIEHHLLQIVMQLLINKGVPITQNALVIETETFQAGLVQEKKRTTTRKKFQPPRKKIVDNLTDDIKDVQYLFYGRLYVRWFEQSIEEEWSHVKAHLFLGEKGPSVCSLLMTPLVFQRVTQKIPNRHIREPYNMAFITQFKKNDKGYWEGYIKHSCFLSAVNIPPTDNPMAASILEAFLDGI